MAKKRYKGYEIVLTKRVDGKRNAQVLAEELKTNHGGWAEIIPLALDFCPGDERGYTQDHAHARYDGDIFCPYCKGKL